MIRIDRLPEPAILAKNKQKWLKKYLAAGDAEPGKRPQSSQYAHPDIVQTLEAMSHHKCFYCEQSTKDSKREVDHYVGVHEEPRLAFDWDNLYLSCQDCNRHKCRNSSVSIDECLDPCSASTHPEAHLTFDGEFIRPKSGSARGRNTIQKYALDRTELDHKRVKQLQMFHEVAGRIHVRMISDGRKKMTEQEREICLSFQESEHVFSLMFKTYLEMQNLAM